MENTNIPVLGHADGICHVYVDGDADLDMAVKLAVDSKCQYVAVCNAAETMLVDEKIAERFLPKVKTALEQKGIELRGCERTRKLCRSVGSAGEDDWSTEYLAMVLSIKIVSDCDEAIEHINRYGSRHTDAIVTENISAAEEFVRRVDSASVMVNPNHLSVNFSLLIITPSFSNSFSIR